MIVLNIEFFNTGSIGNYFGPMENDVMCMKSLNAGYVKSKFHSI